MITAKTIFDILEIMWSLPKPIRFFWKSDNNCQTYFLCLAFACIAHMLDLAKTPRPFCWKFLWGREMGVMGGVRRRCDTVTAFMFLPKDPDPRGGNSDPFSCQHHSRLDEKMLMPPFSQKSVLKGLFYSFYLFTQGPSSKGGQFWPPINNFYSSLSSQHHIILSNVRDIIRKNYALFHQNWLLLLDLLFAQSSTSKGLLPPICYVTALLDLCQGSF